MKKVLNEERFNPVSAKDKAFILGFNREMTKFGYDSGNRIGSGFCWGKYMVVYTKKGVKSKKVYARIYIRKDHKIVLRLFLNNIDKHREYLENTPPYIKEVFTGDRGKCRHCKNQKGPVCKFRKTYTLDGRKIEKCNGYTFSFVKPDLKKLPGYMGVFTEFYPKRRNKA